MDLNILRLKELSECVECGSVIQLENLRWTHNWDRRKAAHSAIPKIALYTFDITYSSTSHNLVSQYWLDPEKTIRIRKLVHANAYTHAINIIKGWYTTKVDLNNFVENHRNKQEKINHGDDYRHFETERFE